MRTLHFKDWLGFLSIFYKRPQNQNPSLSSLGLFSGLCLIHSFHSYSESRACVSEGSTHDSECMQPAIIQRAVRDLLSHLACYLITFFRFHTSLRAVSTTPFSRILGCAFKPVKSTKSLDLTHWGTRWGKTPWTRLFLLGNDSSTKQFRGCASAVTGNTLQSVTHIII